MRITIETNEPQEAKLLLKLLQELGIDAVNILDKQNSVEKGDKSIDPNELFGIWRERPRTLEQIRDKAWKRK